MSLFGGFKTITSFIGGIVTPATKLFDWINDIGDIGVDQRGLEISREGSNINLPVVYGERLVGGITLHKWVTDDITGLTGITDTSRKNAYLHMIVAFAHGEIESYETFYFNGEPSTASQYSNAFYVNTRNGSVGQSVITQAVANIDNWESTMIGNRVAYAYFCFYQDKDQTIWRGEPQIQAVIKGRKVYDPRTTLTQWSDNNALCTLDYLTDDLYGRGLGLSEIDVAKFEEMADFCDEVTTSTVTTTTYEFDEILNRPVPVTTSGSVDILRYTMDAVIDTGEELIANYRRLLQSFRAYPRRSNGLVSLDVETSGSPVMTFDSALGQINGNISYQNLGQRNRYNSFIVTFPNESNRYERDEVTYPDPNDAIYSTWLAEDNDKELIGNLEVNTLSSKSAALQTAEIAAKRSRYGGRLNINVDSRARLLEGGDIIGVSDVSYGWTDKPFRVERSQEQSNGTFDLELSEHENNVYPWSGSSWDQIDGGTWLGNPYTPDAPTNLSIANDPTLATTGTLTWDSVDDNFVRYYDVTIERVTGGVGIIKEDETRGTRYVIQLLDVGEYNISVYAVTTLGYRSSAAVANFTLTIPAQPSSITLTVNDWDIYAAPQLAGIGLGTQFEFDYVQGDGSGHTPTAQASGTSYTITGLLPNTLYTVFARTVNPYGESAWVSNSATTTDTGNQVAPFIDPIQQEIDSAQEQIDDLGYNRVFTRSVAQSLTDEFNNWKRVENIDTETRQRKQDFYQLSVEIDTVDGQVTATNTRIDQVEVDVSGNTSAISLLDVRVADNEDFAAAQLILNSGYDAELGELSARAWLGVDINDRVTGINIEGNPDNGVISFIGDKVEFLRPTDFSVGFQWDGINNTFVFDGKIIATDSTFTGTVTASDINGGTVTGSTIQSASSGQRVYISGTEQRFYPATGTDYVSLDGVKISEGSDVYGYVTIAPSTGFGGFKFEGGAFNDADIKIGGGNFSVTNGTSSFAFNDNGNTTMISTSSSVTIFETGTKRIQFTSTQNMQSDITLATTLNTGTDFNISAGSTLNLSGDDIAFNCNDQTGTVTASVNNGTTLQKGHESYSISNIVRFRCYYNDAQRLVTTDTGVTVTGTVNETSDPSLKDFEHELDGAKSLEMLLDLELWQYKFKANKDRLHVGINAEQAKSSFSAFVEQEEDGTLSFEYKALFVHGMAAIKHLNERLTRLEEKL